jgi:roadblock/LC7 domain-containing protein
MAWTQSDVDTLKQAIATGAKRVRYADGREVEYRTLNEMERTLATMLAEVAPANVPPGRFVVGFRSNVGG